MNNAWRIPTKAQLDALYNSENTSSKWVSGWTSIGNSNGGYFITSEKNGLSLFLAAAGYYDKGSLVDEEEGDWSYFWSSTPLDVNYARLLYFSDGNINSSYMSRGYGSSVRPVQNKVTL